MIGERGKYEIKFIFKDGVHVYLYLKNRREKRLWVRFLDVKNELDSIMQVSCLLQVGEIAFFRGKEVFFFSSGMIWTYGGGFSKNIQADEPYHMMPQYMVEEITRKDLIKAQGGIDFDFKKALRAL